MVETVGFEVGWLLALVLWERGEERQRTSSSRRSLSAPAAAWVGTGSGGRDDSRRRSIASASAPGITSAADLRRRGVAPAWEVEAGWACANEGHATPARRGGGRRGGPGALGLQGGGQVVFRCFAPWPFTFCGIKFSYRGCFGLFDQNCIVDCGGAWAENGLAHVLSPREAHLKIYAT